MQFDPIPGIANYRITKQGIVMDIRTGAILPVTGGVRRFVYLDNIQYAVDRLLVWTYVGRLELDIYERIPLKPGEPMIAGNYGYIIRSLQPICVMHNQTLYLLNGRYLFITIPEFPNYIISDSGTTISIAGQPTFMHMSYANGYQNLNLSDGTGIMRKVLVHRAVYSSWVGPIPEDKQVDHFDNCRWHNHYSNLQLLTRRDNMRKGFMDKRATEHTGWTDEEIRDICQMMVDGASNRDIAQKYNVPFQERNEVRNFTDFLGRIKRGICFTEIASEFDFSQILPATNNPNTKLTREDVEKIWELCKQGKTSQSIADEFGCTAGTIDAIRWGRTWRKVTGLPPYRPGKGSTVVERIA